MGATPRTPIAELQTPNPVQKKSLKTRKAKTAQARQFYFFVYRFACLPHKLCSKLYASRRVKKKKMKKTKIQLCILATSD